MIKKDKNYLNWIPQQNPRYPYEMGKDGLVTVLVTHRGIYHRIAQKVFHTPALSKISLDRFGSFIWQQIDGHHSIMEIAQLFKQEFGEEAEPLYQRIALFFRTLQMNRFVLFETKIHAPLLGGRRKEKNVC